MASGARAATAALVLLSAITALAQEDSVSFEHVSSYADPATSTVITRFLHRGPGGSFAPSLSSCAFVAQTGADNERISNGCGVGRRGSEGDMQAEAVRGFGATTRTEILLDTSFTIDYEDLYRIVHNFTHSLMSTAGTNYVKVTIFSGAAVTHTLTSHARCPEGFCGSDEMDVLESAFEQLRSGDLHAVWPDFDPGSTNLFGSLTATLEGLVVACRAHADLLLTASGQSPSAMTGALVLFSDMSDAAARSTLEEVEQATQTTQEDISLSVVALDMDQVYAASNPQKMLSINHTRERLAAVAENFFHGRHLAHLIEVFTQVAQELDDAANAWYELSICPPQRAGTNVPMTIRRCRRTPCVTEADMYPGSAQISFDATGFSNTCPHGRDTAGEMETIAQDETTSICHHRTADDTCRFVDGVFCGICAIAAAEQQHRLHMHETAVLRIEPPAVNPPESSSASMREIEIQCLDIALEACPCGLVVLHIEETDGTTRTIREGQDYDGIVGLQPADETATASGGVSATRLQVHGSAMLTELLLQVTPTTPEAHWLSTVSNLVPLAGDDDAVEASPWWIMGIIGGCLLVCAIAVVCCKYCKGRVGSGQGRRSAMDEARFTGGNVGGLGPWHDSPQARPHTDMSAPEEGTPEEGTPEARLAASKGIAP